jgi:hypothetical protein
VDCRSLYDALRMFPGACWTQVGPQPLIQIFLFCGVIEFITNKGKVTILDMFSDPSRVPGKGLRRLRLSQGFESSRACALGWC